MNQGIVVVTHGLLTRSDVLEACLDTLVGVKHPVWLAINGLTNSGKSKPFTGFYDGHDYVGIPWNGHEVGAIKAAFERTSFDEIFFLHDTCHVKDHEIFDIAFNRHPERSVAVSPNFMMLIGKYRRDAIVKTTFPEIHSKRDAVVLGEFGWNAQYMAAEAGNWVLVEPALYDNPAREVKWGRENMVLENPWLKKWKGTWDLSMIKE